MSQHGDSIRLIAMLGLAIILMTVHRVPGQELKDSLAAIIDSNNDGRITGGELQNAASAIGELDKDNDGVVSIHEVNLKQKGGGGSRLGGYTTPPPANSVPAHRYNVILGRLTDQRVTVRVLFHLDVNAFIAFGLKPDDYSESADPIPCNAGVPVEIVIDGLQTNCRCYSRLSFQTKDGVTDRSANLRFIPSARSGARLPLPSRLILTWMKIPVERFI